MLSTTPTTPTPATDRHTTDAPLDILWQGRAVIWVVLAAEGLAAVLTLASDAAEGLWVRFGLISLLVQWIALLTLGGLYLMRHRLRALRPQLIAYIALALLVVCSWLVMALCAWLLSLYGPSSLQNSREWLLRVTAIALIVGWLGLAAFQNHWRTQQLAVRAKQAELAMLRARVRPHFLFNTLNTGAALVHHRPDEAEHLLLDLADLFRAALNGAREIPLHEEIALVRRYLEIESLRFGERMHVRWQLPDPLPRAHLPALSIQPLVENAIKHGIERIPGGGEIDIVVRRQHALIEIEISNPISESSTAHASRGHNVGLPASLASIEAFTEGRGSVSTRIEGGRFVASVTLPADD